MTNRLEILKNSLEKKKKVLDQRFKTHFDDVKSGNGQPMNDKRNGAATFKRWDKQEEAIRSQKKEIEKTKNAIEREKSKIKHCEAVNKEIPEPILKLVGSGQLSQWRKFPNRFFVAGVENARIIWDIKKQKLLCSHIAKIPNNDQYAKFRDIFNN
jgi:RNA polymerase-binding transcription factor DksA